MASPFFRHRFAGENDAGIVLHGAAEKQWVGLPERDHHAVFPVRLHVCDVVVQHAVGGALAGGARAFDAEHHVIGRAFPEILVELHALAQPENPGLAVGRHRPGFREAGLELVGFLGKAAIG